MRQRWFDYLASALIVLVCLLAIMRPGPWLGVLALVPCIIWGMLARGWQHARMDWAMLQLGLVLPIVVCVTTMITFTMVESWPLITVVSAFCLGIVGMIVLGWLKGRRRYEVVVVGQGQAAATLLFLSVWGIIYGVTLFVDVNAMHEIRASVLRGTVIERQEAHGRASARLWLTGEPAKLGIDTIAVQSGLFEQTPLGAMVCVRVHQGWLHLRWYEAEAC